MQQTAADANKEIYDLVELVNQSDISSIRNIVSKLIQIINDPTSTAKDMKEIIQVDPPLTAKILRLANSALYSPRSKIGDIQQAVIWIGYDAVKELALSQKVCEIFKKEEAFLGYSRNALWKHSLGVAIFSKTIYRREFGENGENAYAAGLLHDMGLIVEDQFRQENFRHCLTKSREQKSDLHKVEKKVFRYDHAAIGKAIIDDWEIPNDLGVAVGNHHAPNGSTPEVKKMTSTLHVADHFCQIKGIGYADAPFEDKEHLFRSMRELGIEYQALELIAEEVQKEISKMQDQGFFDE
jgi:putative nucleotidyltransferase with HDIG domain